MRLRWAVLAFALLALLIAGAPASLLDTALARASQGRLRILDARGTLWSGAGSFASLGSDERSAQPWLVARWRVDFAALASARLGWQLAEGGRTVLHVQVGAEGVDIREAAFDGALRPLLESIPHPLARAGWRGAARLASPGWSCDWAGACRGSATLRWVDAGVDLVPGRRLGDYEVLAHAQGESGTLTVRTLAGELAIDGSGGWREGRLHFSGKVRGPAEIVGRLPNVMDGVAFPTEDPTVAEIELR